MVDSKSGPKNRTWYSRLKWGDWFTVAGGVIIFGSWLVQNKWQAEWESKIQILQRSQLVVDIEETHRSLWEVAYYNELRRQPIDSLYLAIAVVGVTRTRLNLYTWGIARVREYDAAVSGLMQAKRQIVDTSMQYLRDRNYEPIFEAFRFVNDQFGKNYIKLDDDFSIKVDEVRVKQEFWNRIFLGSYIFGSILLGISFIHSKISDSSA